MPRKPTRFITRLDVLMESAQAQADEWNRTVPVGTPVRYFPTLGLRDSVQSKTRSAAWVMPCGIAVCSIEDHAGGMSLDHLRADWAKAA